MIGQLADDRDILGVVLSDEKEQRCITILIETEECAEFQRFISDEKARKGSLPQLLVQTLRQDCNVQLQIVITAVKNGAYQADLYNVSYDTSRRIRLADALTLAVTCNISILINRRLFQEQSLPYTSGSPAMSLPINAMPMRMLKIALSNAVKEEKYELASKLRDEMNARHPNPKTKE